jgi:hypothetical protein
MRPLGYPSGTYSRPNSYSPDAEYAPLHLAGFPIETGTIELLTVGRRLAQKEIEKLGRTRLDCAGCQDTAELLQSGELGSREKVMDSFSRRVGDGEVEFRKITGRTRRGDRGGGHRRRLLRN